MGLIDECWQGDAWCCTVSTSPLVPPRSGKELLSLSPDEAAKHCLATIRTARDALIRAGDALHCDRATEINWTYVWDQFTRAYSVLGAAQLVATGKMNPGKQVKEMDTGEFDCVHASPFVAGPVDVGGEGGAS